MKKHNRTQKLVPEETVMLDTRSAGFLTAGQLDHLVFQSGASLDPSSKHDLPEWVSTVLPTICEKTHTLLAQVELVSTLVHSTHMEQFF